MPVGIGIRLTTLGRPCKCSLVAGERLKPRWQRVVAPFLVDLRVPASCVTPSRIRRKIIRFGRCSAAAEAAEAKRRKPKGLKKWQGNESSALCAENGGAEG